jgi:hypothetical protein
VVPSARLIVPSSEALTPLPALGVPLILSCGHAAAHAPLQADWFGWSFPNRYSVRPLPLTRIVPSLVLVAVTAAWLDCPLVVVGELPEPYAPPPELEPPELLPLHAPASTPAAASAVSATSGRRMNPNLLGRNRDPARLSSSNLLVTDQMRIRAPLYLETRLARSTTSW